MKMNEFEKLQETIDGIADNTMGNMTAEYKKALNDSRDIIREYADRYGTLEIEVLRQNGAFIEMQNRLAGVIETVRNQVPTLTINMLREVYTTSYNESLSIINAISDDRFESLLTSEAIEEVIEQPINNLTISQRLARNKRGTINDLLSTVERGLREGKTYGEMSKIIQDRYEVDINSANRVVRTESHRVMEKSKADSMQDAVSQGATVYKYWLTAQDERVRTSHSQLGAKYDADNPIPVDEPFEINGMAAMQPSGFGIASEDINCRCVAAYTTEGGENA